MVLHQFWQCWRGLRKEVAGAGDSFALPLKLHLLKCSWAAQTKGNLSNKGLSQKRSTDTLHRSSLHFSSASAVRHSAVSASAPAAIISPWMSLPEWFQQNTYPFVTFVLSLFKGTQFRGSFSPFISVGPCGESDSNHIFQWACWEGWELLDVWLHSLKVWGNRWHHP